MKTKALIFLGTIITFISSAHAAVTQLTGEDGAYFYAQHMDRSETHIPLTTFSNAGLENFDFQPLRVDVTTGLPENQKVYFKLDGVTDLATLKGMLSQANIYGASSYQARDDINTMRRADFYPVYQMLLTETKRERDSTRQEAAYAILGESVEATDVMLYLDHAWYKGKGVLWALPKDPSLAKIEFEKRVATRTALIKDHRPN